MRKSILLVRSSMMDGVRWARQHLYVWLVLGPIVLGLTYLSASRLAETIASIHLSNAAILIVVACLWLAFVAIGLSRVSSDIYHVRHAESHFDALPVRSFTFLIVGIARVLLRLLFAGAMLVATKSMLLPEADLLSPSSLLFLLALIGLTASFRVYASLNWIHWSHTRSLLPALASVAVALVCSLLAATIVVLVFDGHVALPASASLLAAVALILILAVISFFQHERWRQADLEYARRLPSGTTLLNTLPSFIGGRRSIATRVQLARDLRLTIRGFSSAVYVILAIGILLPLALLLAMKRFLPGLSAVTLKGLDATWLPQVIAIKAACVLETCIIVGLVPVLVAHELPHFWLERAVGSSGLDVWDAKLSYARVISLPGCLLVCLAGLGTLTVPAFYSIPLIAECLWLWWLISSLSGALAFEMPTRPGLALLFITTVSLAAGAITTLAWPAGLLTYAQAMHSLTQRGRQRARYYLLTEAE